MDERLVLVILPLEIVTLDVMCLMFVLRRFMKQIFWTNIVIIHLILLFGKLMGFFIWKYYSLRVFDI